MGLPSARVIPAMSFNEKLLPRSFCFSQIGSILCVRISGALSKASAVRNGPGLLCGLMNHEPMIVQKQKSFFSGKTAKRPAIREKSKVIELKEILWAIGERMVVFFPIAVNLTFAWVFGRTLKKGKEPLITTFARLDTPELPETAIPYTRRLTWIWTLYFLTISAISLWMLMDPPHPVVSTGVAVAFYTGAAVLFFGEYIYRIFTFKDQTHSSPIELYKKIKQRGILRVRDSKTGSSNSQTET